MIQIGGLNLDPEEIMRLPLHEQKEVLKLITQYEEKSALRDARKTFHGYMRYVYRGFIDGAHIRKTAEVFDGVVAGQVRRFILAMPPRHMKSVQASILFPSFFMGHFPDRKVLQTSNTAELAQGFGRQVRDTIMSERHQEVFPGSTVKADNKAAGRWTTPEGGEYFAQGVGGAVAGRGAHYLGIDDPHSDQEGMMANFNPKVFDKAWSWYGMARQRLQPGGAIGISCTRWGKGDLTGRVIQQAIDSGAINEWTVLEFPALLPSGKNLWPEFWSLQEILDVKRDIAPSRWLAQYQQTPTSEEGSIVPKSLWRPWEQKRPPELEFIVQAWDTAYTSKTSSDFSACSTWGIFHRENSEGKLVPNAILLHAYRDRVEFPRLKELAREFYRDFQPDTVIIEAKSAGLPLMHELRFAGVPCQDFTPTRGNDKLVRLNSVADLFKSGLCWFMTESNHINAIERTIDEFNDFPAGTNDDLLDASVMCLMRFKQGLFLGAPTEFYDEDEEVEFRPKARRYY